MLEGTPPYHSKYNPIERTWGVLEQHWNGALLDSRQTVLRFASTMTRKSFSLVVKFVDKIYHSGVALSQQAMAILELRFQRLPALAKAVAGKKVGIPVKRFCV